MAVGTFAYPGAANTFVPNHDATGKLVVEYSRNVDDFIFNQYVQLAPVKKSRGYYVRITPEEAARVINSDLAEFVWPDGSPRPQRNNGTESFAFADYECTRYDYDFTLGDESREQADWDIEKSHVGIKAQQAMTARGVRIHSVIADAAQYPPNHSIAVSNIDGNTGYWDASTSERADIKRSINHGVTQIMLATLSMVRRKDLVLVMSPSAAHKISETQEIIDHIKGSPEAYSQVIGQTSKWGEYQLPDTLYGVSIAVEDGVRVSSKRGAAKVSDFLATDDFVQLLARPGSLVSASGGPSWSTVSIFLKEDMTVESKRDEDDRRLEGHVVDNFDVVMTAPASGFLFTDVFTPVVIAISGGAMPDNTYTGKGTPKQEGKKGK